jgi:hypothetical protein
MRREGVLKMYVEQAFEKQSSQAKLIGNRN